MKYHVICEEERENKKVILPRVDRILDTEKWEDAYRVMKAIFPKHKTIRVYKCTYEKEETDAEQTTKV